MAGGTARDEESIGELFGRLADDGKDLVRAEVNLQVQSLLERFREVRGALVLVVVALLLVQWSLVGVIVGSVIALARFVGPFGAGLLVTAIVLALAGLFGWLAARSFSAAFAKHAKS